MMPAGASEVDDRLWEAGHMSSRCRVPRAHPAGLVNAHSAAETATQLWCAWRMLLIVWKVRGQAWG